MKTFKKYALEIRDEYGNCICNTHGELNMDMEFEANTLVQLLRGRGFNIPDVTPTCVNRCNTHKTLYIADRMGFKFRVDFFVTLSN